MLALPFLNKAVEILAHCSEGDPDREKSIQLKNKINKITI
jgi:hypothetical protein